MKRDRQSLIAIAVLVIVGVAAMVYLQEGDDVADLDSNDAQVVVDDGKKNETSRHTGDVPLAGDEAPSGEIIEEGDQAPELPAPKSDSSHILGRVTDRAKKPIAGAVIALCLDVSDFRSRGHISEVLSHVVSDEQGFFRMENVHVGEVYSLRAESPGFASKYVTGLELEAGGSKTYNLTMLEGLALKGVVTDLNDQPLAGARVFVQDVAMQVTDKLGGVERETKTDADGRFVISNLNQGFKNFSAAKPGYATKTMFNFHVHFSQTKRDFTFKLGPGSKLAGVVIDEHGNGISGVEISAQPYSGRSGRMERNSQVVRSDGQGEFSFDGLVDGDYHLTCKKLGYFSPMLRILAKTSGPKATIHLKRNPIIRGRVVDATTHEPVTRFTLYATPRDSLLFVSQNAKQKFESEDGTFEFRCLRNKGDLFLHLEAPGYATGSSGKLVLDQQETIDGVVVKAIRGATVFGTIIDPQGAPVAGAHVEMETIHDGSEGLGRLGSMVYGKLALLQRKVKSDSKGNFRISRLRPARYRLVVKHSAFADSRGDRLLEVEKGGDLPLGDITLQKGGELSGIAYDKDNTPMAGVLIKLVPEDPTLTGGFDIETKTDASGHFVMKHLSAGGYQLQVIRTARLAQIAGQLPNLPTAKYMSVFVGEGEEKKIEVRGL